MDGLASLAAAATIIGDYGEKSNSKSPNKRKQSPKMESPKKRKKKSVTAVQRTMLDFDEEATNVNPSATAAAAPQTEIDPQLAYAMECLTPAVRKRCCRERYKLQHHRQRIRHIQQSELVPSPVEFPYEVYRPIRVGDYVTVYHSPSASLQRGQVLTVQSMSIYGATYRVQFDRVDLGSDVISDEYMAVHGDLEVMGPFRRGQRTAGVCELGHDSEIIADAVEKEVEIDVSPTEMMNRLWSRVLSEAEEMVVAQAPQQDETALLELKQAVAPCMASLLFAQNYSAAIRSVPQEDAASFLSEKLRCLLNADEIWTQKASMLFLLAVNYKI